MPFRREGPPVSSQSASSTKYLNQTSASKTTRFVQWFKNPETLSDFLLVGKAVVASTIAWALAVYVLGSQVAFVAPWTALLTVHATVHRSLSRGAQTTVSSAVGMGLAFVIMQFLGVHPWTFALALLVGLLGARLSWIRDEGVAIATTALFIFTADDPMFGDRFVELLVGVGVGIVVNLLVLPPLKDRQAARYVDSINRRMGTVMVDMADELNDSWDTDSADTWLNETTSMSRELDSAWQNVRLARESERNNPRRIIRHRRTGQQEVSYEEILDRVGEGISHLRNLIRTIREASCQVQNWDEQFRSGWVKIVNDVGLAIADPEGDVSPQIDRLHDLSDELSGSDDLPDIEWPLYGGLITSLHNIMVIVDDVASARQARQTDGSDT